jgi:AraC family transcriptional regulator
MPTATVMTSGGSELRLVRYRSGERQARHAHERSSIALVLRGAVEERVGSSVERGTPLSVVVKPAGIEHADIFGHGGAMTLQLTLSAADRSLAATAGPGVEGWRWCHAEEPARAMLRLARLLQSTPGDARGDRRASDHSGLDDLVCETIATLVDPVTSGGGRPPPWLLRVREALEADPATIRSLAARERVHPVVLARLFRRSFGMTPTAYRRRARARRAASLIANTRGSLCEIALAAGYADQAHLTRDLRRLSGVTPAAMRGLATAG